MGPGDPAVTYKRIMRVSDTACEVLGTPLVYTPRKSPYLSRPYLVIQLFRVSGELKVTLALNTKASGVVKVTFCTSDRTKSPRSPRGAAVILLKKVPESTWVNLCFDLAYATTEHCSGAIFDSLESIEVSPSCIIKWIFASDTPLDPARSGDDVPNKFKIMGTINRATVFVGAPRSKASRATGDGGARPGRRQPLSPSYKRNTAKVEVRRLVPRRKTDPGGAHDSDDDDSDDVFGGGPPAPPAPPPRPPDAVVKDGPPENEEEELELVYIDQLKCYYCPNNQHYYQIDE